MTDEMTPRDPRLQPGVYRDYDGSNHALVGLARDANGGNLARGVKGTPGFWQGPLTDREVVVLARMPVDGVVGGMQVMDVADFFSSVCHDEFCPDYGRVHERGSYSHDEQPRFTYLGGSVSQPAFARG